MAGLVPGRDIEVRYTGRRPGERLHEMLSVVPLIPSIHPRISIADQGFLGPVVLMGAVTSLIRLARFDHKDRLREALLAIAKSTWEEDGLQTRGLDFVIDLTKVGLTEPTASLEAS